MTVSVKTGRDAKSKVLKGINKVSDAVKLTLGYGGRNIYIENYGATKDGVSVARSFTQLKNSYENIGSGMITDVASNAESGTGDGTTTATVLAQAIAVEGYRNVVAGANQMLIKKGIDKATKVVVDAIAKMSIPVEVGSDMIRQVAEVSSNGDEEISRLIFDAMCSIGENGVVRVESAKDVETRLEIVNGMEFDSGWVHYLFATNEKMESELENPYVLVCEKPIAKMSDLMPVLEPVSKEGRPLVIVAEDFEGDALATILKNKMEGRIKICLVKAPYSGDVKVSFLEDIAFKTGATLVSEARGIKLSDSDVSVLGKASKIVVGKSKTTIIGGSGEQEQIDKRVEEIKIDIDNSKNPYEKTKLKERLAKLSGGVAVLYVGAVSEVELRERTDRVDDAVKATQASMEEGIVAGGGVAYIRAIKSLNKLKTDNKDEQVGVEIVIEALKAPLKQMVLNAGGDPSVVLNKVMKNTGNYGYNLRTEKYCDLVNDGIVDPAKVARVAIENASSISGMFLTTESVIVNDKE